jgi:hypothetical protein
MAEQRRFELEELTNRPGTYFNPVTEVLIVVDDSPVVDHEIFSGEEFDSDEWVQISEETPLDERARDELLERFQLSGKRALAVDEGGDEEELDEEDELEPDEESPDYD